MTAIASTVTWARRAILVADVVDSVRLMSANETDVVDRWRRFVDEVRTTVLAVHHGRWVKSTGDGMMLEFADVRSATAAALDLQQRIGAYSDPHDQTARLLLRIGINVANVLADDVDVYGSGVNLAARLSSIANPGEIAITSEVRDEVIDGVDATVEDLGECEFKGLPETVRAFRLHPRGTGSEVSAQSAFVDSKPTIVVLPFETFPPRHGGLAIADVLTDDVISGLSVSPHWNMVSRLSSAQYRGRTPSLNELRQQLRASYVMSGRCTRSGNRLHLTVELAEAVSGTVTWSGTVSGQCADLVAPQNAMACEIVDAVNAAIFSHEMRRARAFPMPTLRSYSVLFGAIGLMHRLSRGDFERSKALLDHLAERHPLAPEPRVWIAKWHVMHVAQGWSREPVEQAQQAHAALRRALDQHPDHALALAMDGLISAFLQGDLTASQRRYEAALAANPNESLAWLFMSALHAYCDRGQQAAEAALTALRLSPIDPMRYYYDSFAANAMLAAGSYDESIRLGLRSIRINCTHMPTYRSLTIAQMLAGRSDDARRTMTRLLEIEPAYSVSEFRRRYAGRDSAHANAYAEALRDAGLPIN